MKSLKEQIEVMEWFLNGGEVEAKDFGDLTYEVVLNPSWDWSCVDYRIKEKKQTVTIEKVLYKNLDGNYMVIECDRFNHEQYAYWKKIKLLDTYEVEL